jgi:hypothetical protein
MLSEASLLEAFLLETENDPTINTSVQLEGWSLLILESTP